MTEQNVSSGEKAGEWSEKVSKMIRSRSLENIINNIGFDEAGNEVVQGKKDSVVNAC